MENIGKIVNRDPKRTLIASLLLPGLGQLYNGEPIKALCFFLLTLATPLTLLRISVTMPGRLLIGGVFVSLIGMITVFIVAIRDGWKTASLRGSGFLLKAYNRWYVYLLLWIAGAVWVTGAVFGYTQNHVVQFCRIVSASMEPALQKGDFVLFDKTVNGCYTPHKNDVVIFRYPDDPSKIFVKRVAGIPGDTLSFDNAPATIVPHGCVFVLGDNRGHAVDSRTFGPIPASSIIGVARQVYFSIGPGGIKWGRIGKTLP
jgi:signal peptidase I